MFNVADALAKHGHEVVPFSIRYGRNQPTPYSGYFVEPLAGRDEVYFRQHRKTLKALLRTLSRLFYAPDVASAVARLARDTHPDVAYVLNYLRKLSPSLLVGLKRIGVPIAARLSDYVMLCPQAHCLRDGQPCELCVRGNLLPSIRYHCIQNSYAASALNVMATTYHRGMRFFDLIDVFVTPTRFMHDKMVMAGYPEARLRHIPTFVDSSVFHPAPGLPEENRIVYAGRLVPSKGIHVLVSSIAELRAARPDLKLIVSLAGSGVDEYAENLKRTVRSLGLDDSIRFVGELDVSGLSSLLSNAKLCVVPSLWYENLPNAILESYACGVPVLASSLGSVVECVEDGRTGYLFRPGDAHQLAERLAYCLDRPAHLAEMGRNARKLAQTTYSIEGHLDKLETLFDELVRRKVAKNPFSTAFQ